MTEAQTWSPRGLFFSHGAVDIGVRALLRCRRIVTDVTLVSSGLELNLLQQLDIDVWCGEDDPQTRVLAENAGIARPVAGIRRAWEKWGNDVVLAIGGAPTAVVETTRLIRELGWRPQLVVGLPVGSVGAQESTDDLRRCLQVPRITDSGTCGGAPSAASVINDMMIDAVTMVAAAVAANKSLVVGIGCRKGVSEEQVDKAVRRALLELGVHDFSGIRELATVDLKATEPALVAFSRRHGIPLRVVAKQQIESGTWGSQPSERVRRSIGLDGVCEPCALIVSGRDRLAVPKLTLDGVAVAIAAE